MARMRTIKPGFFQNDILAEIEPLGRILFAGLWTIADRSGRLEDRPKRIKAELLPYDDCDIETLLSALNEKGFIVRYISGETRYIQVVNFCKHQSPHQKEPESSIPCPNNDLSEHQTSTVQEPDKPVNDDEPASEEPPFNSNMYSNSNNNREREQEQENPVSHPLGVALLTGAGFSEAQKETLSPINYSKLRAAIIRLSQANITPAQIQQASENWWGNSPPNFDQLADEALKVANGTGANTKSGQARTHYSDGREIPKHLRKVVV